ncbi:tetratricopeptide repeat protein [Capilliphycus salinus ALCB114379]|uniref:tetratricopeptide repeat protein n=1 Tax=Capilliphycus salinus TaxID=2768948 RepID=UPI0039A74ADA
MTALSIASSNGSGVNQQVYLRLKRALLLNLRRQILIAVCDDLPLRQRMIARLQTEFTKRENSPKGSATTPKKINIRSSGFTNWVTLTLNLEEPNLIAQIEQWFAENGSVNSTVSGSVVGFQILGVEQLTRQPAAMQWSFLHHLRNLESHLPQLEFSLLLWIPSPWLRCIEQSAPEFWRWRTGVFEFAGDPTPMTATIQQSQDFDLNPVSNTGKPNRLSQSEETGQTRFSGVEGVVSDDSDRLADTKPPANITAEAVKLASVADQNSITRNATQPQTSPPKSVKKPLDLTQTLQKVKRLQQIQTSPKQLTRAYRILIERVRQQMQAGGLRSTEQICLAIEVYETGWQQLENTSRPILKRSEIVDWLNDLGTLYWMRFHQEKAAKTARGAVCFLEQSIIFYQKALMYANPAQQAASCPRLQKNLGAAYGDLARIRDPVENWQQSVNAYGEAIRLFGVVIGDRGELECQSQTPTQPIALSCAATLNNLGTAYWNLAQYTQPSYHLKAAISAYTQAERYYSGDRDRRELGMIQANIGTAYWNLAQHEPEDKWLHLAIEAYQNALKYRSPKTDAPACAATQNNLGIAYWHLASRDQDSEIRARFLKKAIAAYEIALTLVEQLSPTQLNFDPLATHNNLGLAHYQLGKDRHLLMSQTERVAHLEAALRHHLQAGCQQVQPKTTANAVESGRHQIDLAPVIRTMRAIYTEAGLPGQNRALSQIPAHLLSEILRSL